MILFVKLLLAICWAILCCSPIRGLGTKRTKKSKAFILQTHRHPRAFDFLIVARSDFWWAVLVLTVLHAH
jgi:hypothetical protein